MRLTRVEVCVTYGAFERVDLTGVSLDLVSELHCLLPGLLQGLVVLTHCLVQVRHLRRSKVWCHCQVCHYTVSYNDTMSLCLTLDLYHSSASAMFLAAMPSYWALMSLSAAVRSGLDMSIWI